MGKNIRNIGILAHVDAGKTTITENFLFLAGLTRKKGSVDKGSTITDNLKIEKQRGITIRSACVSFEWHESIINLLDTPGHVDFSAEVERVLRVLDGAIVVLSAAEGVQAHTVTIVETLKEMNIPIIFFVNKIDRVGSDFEEVLKNIKQDLSIIPVPLWIPENEATPEAKIINFWEEKLPDNFQSFESAIKESIIELDDNLMENYIEEKEINNSDILKVAIKNIQSQNLVPVFSGIAKKGIGISQLLDAVISFLPQSNRDIENDLSALVYKIEHDKSLGRIAHIKVYDGMINAKDIIYCQNLAQERKIGLTKKIYLNKLEDIDSIKAGDIGVITGISDINTGEILGVKGNIPENITLQKPVMTVQLVPKNKEDYSNLGQALQILESEDPSLSLIWFKEEQEFHISIMGPIQIEILENQILERFSIETEFKNPIIIYKERPIKKTKGFVKYWMPKPCWAIMTFLIEPGELGSGVQYNSIVRQSDIKLKYQNEIARTIPLALKQGLKGWEITDIKITLIEGEDHEIHSRPGDFILATPMGIMNGLEKAGTELLEPILSFKIKAPEEFLGKIASDLTKMRGNFSNPLIINGKFTLSGLVPASTSLDYGIKLNSLTSGKGRVSFKFYRYEPCSDNHGVIREYKGVNPLDESKWILHQRGAYKADERIR